MFELFWNGFPIIIPLALYYSYLRMIPKESLDLEKSFIIFIMDLLAKRGFQTQISAYFLETDF